jgi:hypothetical protein
MGSNMAQDSKVATELRKKANNADGIADSYEGQRQEKWFRGFAEVMRTGAREIELLELEKELLKKALADAVAARRCDKGVISWHSSGPRRRAQSSARARRRDGRNGNGCSGGNALNVPLDSLLASVKLALAVAPMAVGALGLRQPSLSCLRSWAEPVVAAGLRAGLPELHLARLSLYWRLGNCPPIAARPAPCRIGKPALRGL